jgi:tol-pal system protein YbgF
MQLLQKKSVMSVLMLATLLPAVSAAEDNILLEKRIERVERIIQGQGLMNLISRVDQLQAEIQRLNGENEALRHELEQTQKRQRDMYIDLDERMQQQAQQPTVVAPSNAPAVSTATPSLSGQAESAESASTAVESSANTSTPAVVETGEAAYQAALQTLRSGQYQDAINALQVFPEQYPASPYLPNAYYWQGEAKYVLREFAAAAALFQIVIEQFPDSNKVADALLKRGFSEQEMGDTPRAIETLNKVMADYPDSSAAKLAKVRLSRIKSSN